MQKRGIEIMRQVIGRIKMGRAVEVSDVHHFVDDLVSICKNNEDQFATLARLKDNNPVNYLYTHPLNVCIYSMAIGNRLSFDEKQLTNLGLAAILHDIGEVRLPDRMILKAAKYTESELSAIRSHPKLGYELLRKTYLPTDVLMGVLQHHERIDGSGYPSELLGKSISPLGKIVAVAENFDAMITKKVPQNDALKILYSLAGKHYEPDVVKALISLIGLYPMGSLVRLSGGQLAIVMGQNKEDLSKPKVIVITDGTGQNIEPYLLNLYGDVVNRKIMFAEDPKTLGIDINQYVTDAIGKPEEEGAHRGGLT